MRNGKPGWRTIFRTCGRAAALGLWGLWLVSCASGHREPFPPDMPKARDLAAVEARLRKAVARSGDLSLKPVGNVAYGSFQAPIWEVTRRPNGAIRHSVLMAAGIHGNEPAGVEALLGFVESLGGSPDSHPGISFRFIPLVNPWGWCHDIRFNGDGMDVNRDFATFGSQEARIVRDLLLGESFDLMFDLHEDPSARGFYLYQYGRPDRRVSDKVTGRVRAMGFPLESEVNMVILRTEEGIIDAPIWGLWYMRLSGQLSMTNHFRLNNSERVYTVETPAKMAWEDRLSMQRAALDELLRSLEERPQETQ